jgi:hypothetical protein
MRVLNAMEAEADGKPLKPSQIVDGFFGTLLRMADDERRGGITFLRLLGRMLTDPSEFIRAFFAHEYSEVIDRYKEALFKALPDVPKAEIVWRFHFMLGATSYAIAGTDALRVVTDWQIEEMMPPIASPPGAAPDVLPARGPARPLAPVFRCHEAVGK